MIQKISWLQTTPDTYTQMTVRKGLFKKHALSLAEGAVQQGRKQRGGRGVHGGTLGPPSNENAAGGMFQQSQRRSPV